MDNNEASTEKSYRERLVDSFKEQAPLILFGVSLVVVGFYLSRKSIGDKLYTYSYGADCIWKVQATEKEVEAFNRYLKAFYEAQTRVLEKTGKPWDPSNPLWMNVGRGDGKIYNMLANRLNEALKFIDQDKTPIEVFEDFLVKN